MAAPLISLTNVSIDLAGRPVLRGASLEVHAGEVIFAIGRSGAGKSVLSRIALGLLRPNQGAVTLLGQRLDLLRSHREISRARKGSALVIQGAALLSWLSLRDNVALPLSRLGRHESRRLADLALRTVGLSDEAAHRLPGQTSAGERQLTAVARALALEPRAAIFDEPTTGLPLEATLAIERQMRRMAQAGVAVLVVSHDLDSLERCADRFALLVDGHFRFGGTAADLRLGRDPELDLFLSAAHSAHGRAGNARTQPKDAG